MRFFAITVSFFLFCTCANPGPHNFYHEGMRHTQKQHYKEALVLYKEAVRLKPTYIEAHYQAGFSEEKLGNLSGALAFYKAALKLQPTFIDAQNGLARVYLQMNDPQNAYLALNGSENSESIILRYQSEDALAAKGVVVMSGPKMKNEGSIRDSLTALFQEKAEKRLDVVYLVDSEGKIEDIVNSEDTVSFFRDSAPFLLRAVFDPQHNHITQSNLRGLYHYCLEKKGDTISRCKGRYDYGTDSIPYEVIGAYIDKYKGRLLQCYQHEAEMDSKFEGHVLIRFTIAPDGSAKNASIPYNTMPKKSNKEFFQCVTGVFSSIQYPPSRKGKPTLVIYPLNFVIYE